MRWIEASVPTESKEIDALCDLLADMSIDGMSVEDETDFRRFLEENRQYWDFVDEDLSKRFEGLSRIKFYLKEDQEGLEKLEAVKAKLNREIRIAYLEDEDWENNWKQYYAPIEIGREIVVVPEWMDAESWRSVKLRLDPGIAFGTGSHPTTRIVLEELEKERRYRNVLDIGCGSGILGIAALLLGAEKVVGCDIDPMSPAAARRNAALNGIGSKRFKVYAGDVLKDGKLQKKLGTGFDLVLANIVADVIIQLSGIVPRFMTDNGTFICSGIVDERCEEVEEALEENGFSVARLTSLDGWNCFCCSLSGDAQN